MVRIAWKTTLPLLVVMAFALPAQAGVIWLEHGGNRTDTGSLPGGAQVTVGTGDLTGIAGNLGSSPAVDMYKIQIVDPTNFSAIVSGSLLDSAASQELTDSQLFLFDANGHGVLANDDISGSDRYSALPAGSDPSLTAGLYYIAVSLYNRDPVNSDGNQIFNTGSPFTEVVGPDVTNTTVTDWQGPVNTGSGGYLITLTGAAFTNFVPPPSTAPEPSSMTLFALGAIGLAVSRWRRRLAAVEC